MGMREGWADRLRTAISEDGRSMRAISLAAGVGPNYLEQTLNRGSAPTQNKLASIMDQLGPEASLYIYTGVRANAQTIEYLNLLAEAPEDLRASTLGLLREMARGGQARDGGR